MDISPCGFKSRLEYKGRKTKAKALVFLCLHFCQFFCVKMKETKIVVLLGLAFSFNLFERDAPRQVPLLIDFILGWSGTFVQR